MAKLQSVGPISNENVLALPVRELETAIAYYERVLGFATTSQDHTIVRLRRDDAEIGLVVQPNHQSGEAGSIAFSVDDLETLHKELTERGAKPGALSIQEWGGRRFRTFFAREDENGYCFCFHTQV